MCGRRVISTFFLDELILSHRVGLHRRFRLLNELLVAQGSPETSSVHLTCPDPMESINSQAQLTNRKVKKTRPNLTQPAVEHNP